MAAPTLILASGSPRRRELLGNIGASFQVITADVEEVMDPARIDLRDIPKHNAELKARAVAQLHPGRWVLGADTVVVLGERLLGKPPTLAIAHGYLSALSGQTHEVITGCHLVDPDAEERSTAFSDTSRVTFRVLTGQVIERYLAAVHVLDKAGGYALQEHGDWLVESVDGSRDNVLGLPTERLRGVLESRGLL